MKGCKFTRHRGCHWAKSKLAVRKRFMLELATLQERFSREITESTFRDNRRVDCARGQVYPVLEFLMRDAGSTCWSS